MLFRGEVRVLRILPCFCIPYSSLSLCVFEWLLLMRISLLYFQKKEKKRVVWDHRSLDYRCGCSYWEPSRFIWRAGPYSWKIKLLKRTHLTFCMQILYDLTPSTRHEWSRELLCAWALRGDGRCLFLFPFPLPLPPGFPDSPSLPPFPFLIFLPAPYALLFTNQIAVLWYRFDLL